MPQYFGTVGAQVDCRISKGRIEAYRFYKFNMIFSLDILMLPWKMTMAPVAVSLNEAVVATNPAATAGLIPSVLMRSALARLIFVQTLGRKPHQCRWDGCSAVHSHLRDKSREISRLFLLWLIGCCRSESLRLRNLGALCRMSAAQHCTKSLARRLQIEQTRMRLPSSMALSSPDGIRPTYLMEGS